MEIGETHKVWEIKVLKKPGEEEARKMLEKIAKQVQPIMRGHKWKVKLLREFCPGNKSLLGLNVGGGVEVKLRLRRPNRECDFFPYEQVLDTMLHELCHNDHGPHNAAFYKLWDGLRKECEDLISKGVSGTGQGFDLPGRRLGGFSHQPPLPALRQTALAAAEKRLRIRSLLPSGPKRLGGDNDIMSALTPIQAAAMAAERRMHDNLWCGSTSPITSVIDDHSSTSEPAESNMSTDYLRSSSPARKRACNSTAHSEDHFSKFQVTDSSVGVCKSSSYTEYVGSSTSASFTNHHGTDDTRDKAIWECSMCTLFNQPLAPICGACGTEKPKDFGSKYNLWSCKFCTLENTNKHEKCLACESWRYSVGAPISTRGPNLGT